MPCTNCNTNCENCNSNPQHTYPCTETSSQYINCNDCQPQPCDCPVTDLSTDCSTYKGDDITCGEITVIPKNTPLSNALKNIVDWACERFSDFNSFFPFGNLGSGAKVYKGESLTGVRQFRTITSSDNSVDVDELENTIDLKVALPKTITSSDNTVEIIPSENNYDLQINLVGSGETRITQTGTTHTIFSPKWQARNLGVIGAEIFNDEVSSNYDFTFRKINSNTLDISETSSTIEINVPTTFSGLDYYVNAKYTLAEEKGTASKPFQSLKRCIDVILNRAYQNPTTFAWVESPNPAVNGGVVYQKYQERTGDSEGAIRVIIQSQVNVEENIAINRVTYFLERGGFDSAFFVPATGAGASVEYILDMQPLVTDVPKTAGKLPYNITCSIIGQGSLIFAENHPNRKGYVRAVGFSDNSGQEQPDSTVTLGSVGGNILCLMFKKPSLTYTDLTNIANQPISQDGAQMTGYQTLSVPTYGAIESTGANAIFRDNLFLNGTLDIRCFEQHIIFVYSKGQITGNNGSIFLTRNYVHVNYSQIDEVDLSGTGANIVKYYLPSTHVYDIYLKNGSSIAYSGNIVSRENSRAQQGGSEAFLFLENTTTDTSNNCEVQLTGDSIIANLLYNHYIKSVLNSSFSEYRVHNILLSKTRLNSNIFEEAFSFETQTGADWAKPAVINLINCRVNETLPTELVRKLISNIALNTYLLLPGTGVDISRNGFMNSMLPQYLNNADAISKGYPVGGFYRKSDGSLHVVI